MPGKHSKRYFRKYYKKNRERFLEKARKQRIEHPEQVKAYNLKQFNLTPSDYQRMYENQNGLCAVCHQTETRISKNGLIAPLCVDHNHSTGKNRDLLCTHCNLALGHVKDNIQILLNLAEYLRRHDNAGA